MEAEDLATGETWHVGSAYLVFVALDADGKPGLCPAAPRERDRAAGAVRRPAGAGPCAAGAQAAQAPEAPQAEMKPPST